MTITADPTNESNFHIRLEDVDANEIGLIVAAAQNTKDGPNINRDIKLVSRTPIDRTAIKTSQGDTEYSDWRPPYYAMKQDDFSGGRGLNDFTKDRTRFLDSVGLNTRRAGHVHLNAQEQFADIFLRDGVGTQPTDTDWTQFPFTNGTEWATKVTVTANATYDQIWFKAYSTDAISGVKLYDGADAAFETLLQTAPDSIPPIQPGGWHVINLTSTLALVATDSIWISVPVTVGDWVPREPSVGSGSGLSYVLSSGIPVAYVGFAARLLEDNLTPRYGKLFEYKQALYYIIKDGNAVKLYINGYRGVLSVGGTTTVTDGSKSWTTNELAGAVFKVVGGTGVNEAQRWRVISSNTGTVITLEDDYDVALSTDTEYVILGTDVWTEIAGHGLTNIFDVLVGSQGVVYFTQGSTAAMRRMREYNNAGSWTRQFAADSTNQANYLVEVGSTIWRVQNSTGEADGADNQAWGTDLTFDSPANVPCGDSTSAFTGLEAYVDDSGQASPFVFKEEIVGFIETYAGVSTFIPLKIKEMSAMRSEKNGRAHLVQDTYIYFSFNNGLEYYFNPIVKDIGPDKDEGMPANRQGPIVTMVGYPGRFYVGIDAGTAGYSSVLSYSGGGWHEEFTGPYGQRMMSLYCQPVPGPDNLDRLWVAYGSDVNWLPLSSETTNPLNDANMLYTDAGYVETSAYYTELKSARKYISQVKAAFQDAIFGSSPLTMLVDYKLDDGDWTAIEDITDGEAEENTWKYVLTFVESSTPSFGINGFFLNLRIKFLTNDRTMTPVMLALVMEGLARIDNKYAYTIPFVLEGTSLDPAKDLFGTDDDTPAATTKLDQLITWAQSGPLYMESVDSRLDEKMVILLPFAENDVEVIEMSGQHVYLGQLTLQDA